MSGRAGRAAGEGREVRRGGCAAVVQRAAAARGGAGLGVRGRWNAPASALRRSRAPTAGCAAPACTRRSRATTTSRRARRRRGRTRRRRRRGRSRRRRRRAGRRRCSSRRRRRRRGRGRRRSCRTHRGRSRRRRRGRRRRGGRRQIRRGRRRSRRLGRRRGHVHLSIHEASEAACIFGGAGEGELRALGTRRERRAGALKVRVCWIRTASAAAPAAAAPAAAAAIAATVAQMWWYVTSAHTICGREEGCESSGKGEQGGRRRRERQALTL